MKPKNNFRDVAFDSTDKARQFQAEAIDYFNSMTENFAIHVNPAKLIKLIGNVVRMPSWFHFHPQH